MSFNSGELPPQAIELEGAVIGACLLERNAIPVVIELIPQVETFYNNNHRVIYQAIIEMFSNSDPIDILTVTQHLQKQKKLKDAGGAFFITKLTSQINSSSNIEFHCRIIKEKYAMRKIREISGALYSETSDPSNDVFKLLDKADGEMMKLSSYMLDAEAKTMMTMTKEFMDNLRATYQQENTLTGVHTGSNQLDNLTGGFQRTDFIIIAARPSMGKTASICSFLTAQMLSDLRVVFFSLEMSSMQLIQRIISIMTGVELERLRKGQVHDHEYLKIQEAKETINKSKMEIIDNHDMSIIQAKSHLNRIRRKGEIDCVYFDYIQLMNDPSKLVGNREQEIAQISRGLKGIAKSMNVPVIGLSQLSRAVETRGGDKKPMLSDLRESGSIEQDADMVCFLWRPAYYGFTEDGTGNGIPEGYTELNCAKYRNGGLFNHKMTFIKRLTKFTDYQEQSFKPSEPGDDFFETKKPYKE